MARTGSPGGKRGGVGGPMMSFGVRRRRRFHPAAWLAALLAAAFVGLQYRLWFGDGSVPDVIALRAAVESQREENARLDDRNRELEAEVVDLKTGVESIEYRARHDLGMIRNDETFYQIVEER